LWLGIKSLICGCRFSNQENKDPTIGEQTLQNGHLGKRNLLNYVIYISII